MLASAQFIKKDGIHFYVSSAHVEPTTITESDIY
jgi:hypothetical protein